MGFKQLAFILLAGAHVNAYAFNYEKPNIQAYINTTSIYPFATATQGIQLTNPCTNGWLIKLTIPKGTNDDVFMTFKADKSDYPKVDTVFGINTGNSQLRLQMDQDFNNDVVQYSSQAIAGSRSPSSTSQATVYILNDNENLSIGTV
ncbi:hypothetical protein BB558_005227 [Smittium angustum]|uniref:Galactose mutarotase N-terminal barrel domain-containing protein n=1 Tax=Smittium angustum TaxID=133377 RepID=A0A2U1J112_SMIAN|nr:hypothetical protein BB558_005227 [Smittium angustum]